MPPHIREFRVHFGDELVAKRRRGPVFVGANEDLAEAIARGRKRDAEMNDKALQDAIHTLERDLGIPPSN